MEVTWSEFKNFVTQRNISIQFVEMRGNYFMKAFDGGFNLECVLPTGVGDSETTEFETSFKAAGNKTQPQQMTSFSAKTLANGKKLYKREHGIQATLTTGANNILFTIPYAWVKIIGLELMGGETLDTVDFYVLDSTTGTYSTVPNYVLNQFGFSVNVSAVKYEETCNYDADLYYGMQIKIVYNSISNKTVGINFNLNEVKS
jgi:hypothetical protein